MNDAQKDGFGRRHFKPFATHPEESVLHGLSDRDTRRGVLEAGHHQHVGSIGPHLRIRVKTARDIIDGMNVIVTGGTGALGGAVVKTFLDAGHRVLAVGGHHDSDSVQHEGLMHARYDLTLTESAAQLVDEAIGKLGSFEVVVHTMGAFAGGEPVQKTSTDTWNTMLNVNLNAAFFLMRAAVPHLLQQKRGRVLAVGSRAAVQPAGGLSAYVVSKAGLQALMATLAIELTGSGVTANTVLPSVIDTPANRKAMPRADFSRWVTPEAIAKLLLWLASDDTDAVNGAAIPIYGNA
jgi:NAD(P)-dependent dehydrogenase (short-subunit alcohol dehydrogenase family)